MSEQSAADVIAEALTGIIYDRAQLVQGDAEDLAWDVAREALAALEPAGWATVKLPTDPQLNPRWRTLARINPGKATEFALSLLAAAREADNA